jgi:hypothetical protein
LKHQYTTISETTVRMRFANESDPEQADSWFEFEVPMELLKLPQQGGPERDLGDPDTEHLGAVRLGALRYVRDVIGAETQRLARLASQTL